MNVIINGVSYTKDQAEKLTKKVKKVKPKEIIKPAKVIKKSEKSDD